MFYDNRLYVTFREESISKMLIAKEQGEAGKKLLESERNIAEQRLLGVIQFNAAIERKLFDER